jgi:tetratricopeptide (TPR) repeat protein
VAIIQNGQRLDGWKAIANFLGRERSTAIRWANDRGLPIHRVPGGRTGTVYAMRDELTAWLESEPVNQNGNVGHTVPTDMGSTSGSQWPRNVTIGIVALLGCALIAAWWMFGRASALATAPVSIAAVASPTASPETAEFARMLTADLARFASASANLAIFEPKTGVKSSTQYAVRTEIERAGENMTASARLISGRTGQVLWSRRFQQSGSAPSVLRERVAANIVGVLRCSFGMMEDERAKASEADLMQLMTICDAMENDDPVTARINARQLTVSRPDLAIGWAILAIKEGEMADDTAASTPEVRSYAERARKIAPGHAITWIALASATSGGFTNPNALAILDEALREHPSDPWLLSQRGLMLFNLGYVQDSVTSAMSAYRNDPSSFGGRDIAVRRLAAAGRTQEALQLQAENERLWPGHPQVFANRAQIASDRTARHDTDFAAIRENEDDFAGAPYVAYLLARLYERTGNRQAALAWLARAPSKKTYLQYSLLFWPDAAGLRTEPAFFRKMADLGLVRYWVARKQWPDFCREPGLKYDCADEAPKLGIR